MKKNEESEKSTANTNIILGYIAVKDFKTIPEKIGVLSRLGFSNGEMSIICNTTPSTIKTEKSKLKKS